MGINVTAGCKMIISRFAGCDVAILDVLCPLGMAL